MVKIECTFEAAARPFWHGRDVVVAGAVLKDRGGRRKSVVAVHNPGTGDHMLKVWLDAPVVAGTAWSINDVLYSMVHQGDGLYQGALAADQMRSVLRLPGDEFLDMCVETQFYADQRSRWGGWRGDTDGFPEWMGRVTLIEVTPPDTGGGPHGLTMEAKDIKPCPDIPQMIRINRVWCYFLPCVDTQDSEGVHAWDGRWSIICDPRELDVIRSYGSDDSADETDTFPDPEPVPPRWPAAVRRLHLALPDGLSLTEYYAWTEDTKTLQDKVRGISIEQGQLDLYDRRSMNLTVTADHYKELIAGRFRKRPRVYKDYTVEAWLEEGVDEKAVRWADRAEDFRIESRDTRDHKNRRNRHITYLRRVHDAALARCEEREAEYADEIAGLYTYSGDL